jgi:lipopolysaccharide/colanic/teichoic acid biosynthesis glycosyltransferase
MLLNTNNSQKTNNKNIIVIGNNYKFIEPNRLKNYNFIYISNINEVNNFDNIDYIVINKNINNPRINNSSIKVVTLSAFLESELHKLYLNENIKLKTYSKWQYAQKRVIDLLAFLAFALLAWPILIYSVYKIKKESPDGPILFKQKRVGKDGKEFVCYKFRSMRTNVDYSNDYTQENDPRIFKWGKFMRKSRIDELPQFLNVLKGEMHLVGPRAEWNKLVKDYEKQIPIYHERHQVTPGITGWAQVNHPYGANLEDTKQKLMYDLYYIKKWSLTLEIKTIFKTIAVVLGKRGM